MKMLSRSWSHPVVLNAVPPDWESNTLTAKPLIQDKKQFLGDMYNSCFDHFSNILRKSYVVKYIFNTGAGLQIASNFVSNIKRV